MSIARFGSSNVWLSCLFYQLSCPSLRPNAAKLTSAVPKNTAAYDVLLGGIALMETEIKLTKNFDPNEHTFNC
jgi:hypothetical protein